MQEIQEGAVTLKEQKEVGRLFQFIFKIKHKAPGFNAQHISLAHQQQQYAHFKSSNQQSSPH